jgi:hypothetical protein
MNLNKIFLLVLSFSYFFNVFAVDNPWYQSEHNMFAIQSPFKNPFVKIEGIPKQIQKLVFLTASDSL